MCGKESMKKSQTQPRAMKKLYALTEKRPLDLSLSENSLGCSPLVSDALSELRVEFNDYPAPNGKQLRNELAQKFSLRADNLFVANGSESVINDLPRIFCNIGDEVIVPELTFPMFKICSELAGARVLVVKMTDLLGIDLLEILESISGRTRMIFLCNPNNPTGSVVSREAIISFIKKVPKNVKVVVDEANIEFGGESVIDQAVRRNNVIVLRTLSKGFGLATLRVGYAVASREIIQKFEEETPVFQLSGISEQLACIALKDDEFLRKTKQMTTAQRIFLRNELEELGFTIFPSDSNNLFVKVPSFLSVEQFAEQLGVKGISVVMGSSFDGFDDSFFRISVRDAQTNEGFIRKMKEIVEEAL